MDVTPWSSIQTPVYINILIIEIISKHHSSACNHDGATFSHEHWILDVKNEIPPTEHSAGVFLKSILSLKSKILGQDVECASCRNPTADSDAGSYVTESCYDGEPRLWCNLH